MSLEDYRIPKENQIINELNLGDYEKILLDGNGDKTELYSILEQAYEICPNKLRLYLYKMIERFKKLLSEVIDAKDLSDEMIKLICQEAIYYVVEGRNGDKKAPRRRLKSLKEKLTKIRENELKSFNNEELMSIAEMIENALNSTQVIELEKSILGDKTYYGEHSSVNLQGIYMATSLVKIEMLQKLVVDYIIIHRDDSQIGEYITYLQNSNLQDKSIEDITRIGVNFHINYILKKHPELTDEEVFNQIYNNYVTNGFVFQGLNGSFMESAKQNGISTNFSQSGKPSMEIIDKIFRNHGVKNVMLSKLVESTGFPYYWLTDNFGVASHFSFHNPEYMSMLLATGPYLSEDKEFDQYAFYRRDKDSCIENLKKLCERYHLLEKEKDIVIELARMGLEQLYPTQDVMQYGGVLLIPKKIVKSIKYPVKQTEQDIKSSIEKILDGKIINNYKCFLDISPKAVAAVHVPAFQRILGDRTTPQVSSNIRKFIHIRQENGEVRPLYYDIFIKSPDKSDLDCIVIEEDKEEPYLESKKTPEYGLTVDVISCNSMLKEFDILSSIGGEAQPSFQSIMMMIAVNGVSNSKKGEQLLNRARVEFTPEKMVKYYNFLINRFFKIAGDNKYALNIRLETVKRAIGDFIPKAIYMKGTGRYPSDVNSNYLLMTQYDFHHIGIFIDAIAKMQKQADKAENTVDKLISDIREFIKDYYDFNEGNDTMCKEWFERLGFEDKLMKINESLLKKEDKRIEIE